MINNRTLYTYIQKQQFSHKRGYCIAKILQINHIYLIDILARNGYRKNKSGYKGYSNCYKNNPNLPVIHSISCNPMLKEMFCKNILYFYYVFQHRDREKQVP